MAKTPAHYLIKSEPYKYSFAELGRDGRTRWDGVRSFEARNNLRAMQVGDLALFYHSNEGKEVVGVARVLTAAYPDPTAPGEDWSAVDFAPVVALIRPVTLATIKAAPELAEINLLRRSRLSVVPVTAAEFDRILRLSGTKLPPTAALPPATAAPEPAKGAAARAPAAKNAAPRAAKAKAAKSSATPDAALRPAKTTATKARPAKTAAAKLPATQTAAPRPAKTTATKARPAKTAAPRPGKTAAAKAPAAKASAAKPRSTASTRLRTAAP